MKQKNSSFIVVMLLVGALFASYSFSKKVMKTYVAANPVGKIEEQIAYHEKSIELYRLAIAREEKDLHGFLIKSAMKEARSVNHRIDQYIKKINRHNEEIQRLKKHVE